MNRKSLTSLFYALLAFGASSVAETTAQLDSHDWVKDNIFTAGVEGPAVDAKLNLYAVNYQQQGTIGQVSSKGQVTQWLKLPGDSVGNGIRFDSKGNMLIADYVNHIVWSVDMQSKVLTIKAKNPAMNQPNDIAITSNDIIFASDPNWAKNTGQLWRIDHQGKTQLIASDMGTTNGVEVSPGDKYLYVNESVQRKIWRFELDSNMMPHNKTLFYQFDDHGMDGMRCDRKGNLYIARYGAGVIAMLSPTGKLLKEYRLKGQYPTNLAFGGVDGKQVFVTMQKRGAIETFTTPEAGRAHELRVARENQRRGTQQ